MLLVLGVRCLSCFEKFNVPITSKDLCSSEGDVGKHVHLTGFLVRDQSLRAISARLCISSQVVSSPLFELLW